MNNFFLIYIFLLLSRELFFQILVDHDTPPIPIPYTIKPCLPLTITSTLYWRHPFKQLTHRFLLYVLFCKSFSFVKPSFLIMTQNYPLSFTNSKPKFLFVTIKLKPSSILTFLSFIFSVLLVTSFLFISEKIAQH